MKPGDLVTKGSRGLGVVNFVKVLFPLQEKRQSPGNWVVVSNLPGEMIQFD